jgi:hypothetical protein
MKQSVQVDNTASSGRIREIDSFAGAAGVVNVGMAGVDSLGS